MVKHITEEEIAINQRVKQLRKALKLTQKAFGASIGLSPNSILNLENNKAKPNLLYMEHLCKAYRVRPEWLFTGQGEVFRSVNEEQPITPDPKSMDIGQRIRFLRQRYLKMTHRIMSERVGVNQTLISKIEVGSITYAPKLIPRLISAICTEFGVNRTWLETGEGDIFNGDADGIYNCIDEIQILQPKISSDDVRRVSFAECSVLSDPKLMNIGQRIRFLRKNYLKIPLRVMSACVGIDQTLLSKIEIGTITHAPRLIPKLLTSICASFHVNPVWLETGDGEPFQSSTDALYAILTGTLPLSEELLTIIPKLKPAAIRELTDLAQDILRAQEEET